MTDFLIGGRQTGKTFRAMEFMEAHPECIMVVHSEMEAARLRDAYPSLAPDRFVSCGSNSFKGRSAHTVVVDNAELILERLFGGPVELITGTGRALDPETGEVLE